MVCVQPTRVLVDEPASSDGSLGFDSLLARQTRSIFLPPFSCHFGLGEFRPVAAPTGRGTLPRWKPVLRFGLQCSLDIDFDGDHIRLERLLGLFVVRCEVSHQLDFVEFGGLGFVGEFHL